MLDSGEDGRATPEDWPCPGKSAFAVVMVWISLEINRTPFGHMVSRSIRPTGRQPTLGLRFLGFYSKRTLTLYFAKMLHKILPWIEEGERPEGESMRVIG